MSLHPALRVVRSLGFLHRCFVTFKESQTTMTDRTWKKVAVEWPHMVAGLLGPADAERLRRGRLGAERPEQASESGAAAAALAPAQASTRGAPAFVGTTVGTAVGITSGAAGAAVGPGRAGGPAMEVAGSDDQADMLNAALDHGRAGMAPHPSAGVAVAGAALQEGMMAVGAEAEESTGFELELATALHPHPAAAPSMAELLTTCCRRDQAPSTTTVW